jgi:dipeptidyl aminopeptidase/acylaminoacyl peptidase
MITHSTVRKERGIPDRQPLIDVAAPAYYASAETPPVINIVGGSDLPARAEESRYFIAAMKAAGHKNATYLEVAGRDHGSIAYRIPEADDIVAKTMIEFVHRAKRAQ